MAAMALNSIRVLANARKMAPPFPFGINAKHALTPPLSLKERGLVVRAFTFRNQSLTLGGMDLQAGADHSEAQHRKPHPTTADSAPG